MFQGTLVVSTLLTRFPKWQITVALGILSAIVGSMDIMAWFIPFLLFLGIATPPVAGIYTLKYLSDHPKLQGIAQQNSFKHT